MYAVWVKIDETLPWIELKGTYQTEREAKRVAEGLLNNTKMKIVRVSEKGRRVKP